MISVVVPAFNEEENISDCLAALRDALSGEEHEIIFVDDGSFDRTWEKICENACESVRGIRFSRNFGKEAAIRAGLEHIKGDCAAVIDCDLQHPPALLKKMLERYRAGADVVEGKKSFRGRESRSHGLFAGIFNRMISASTGADMSGASDYILLSKRAVGAILRYNEEGGFFRALALSVGFERESVEYEVSPRKKGSGKFTFSVCVKYAIKNIASFTSLPLYAGIFAGGIAAVLGIVFLILLLCGVTLGFITAGIVVTLLMGSVILFCIGAVGYYVSRIFDEVRNRPKYIVSAEVGGKNEK